MEYYLAVRVRRFARTFTSVGAAEPGSNNGNGMTASSGSPYGRAVGMAGGAGAPTVLRTAPPQRYAAPRPAVRPPRSPGRP